MSTSIHNGRVEFAASIYGAAADPLDTTIMRDGVANGLLHAADSMAQVRVNVMYADSSTFGGSGSEGSAVGIDPIVVNTWYRIGRPFGEWPLTLHANGTPYLLRLRFAGATDGGGAGGTATFRIVIAPNNATAIADVEAVADHVFETAGTVATTPTWLTGATRGSGAYTTYLKVSAEKAAQWTRSVSVYDAVSGASPRAIDQCLVSAHVFAKTTDALDVPTMFALHITEYVGT